MLIQAEIENVKSDILMHFLRAHIVIHTLTNPENLNFVSTCQPFLMDIIFDQIYSYIIKDCLQDFINFDLIAEFVIELFKKQPYQVMSYVINFNLMFVFLENIKYSRVRDALAIFLAPHHAEKEHDLELSQSLWNYTY